MRDRGRGPSWAPAAAVKDARFRAARGFTLIEVLISIALITALLGAMFAFSWDMLAARGHIVRATGQRRAATMLIEGLERDLASCIVGDQAVGAGVAGDATKVRILTRSVPVRFAERGVESSDAFADLERAEYRFDETRGVIEARRTRAETNGGDDGDGFHELGGPVYRLRLRYHDGRGWRESYDSLESDRLPAAVEVAVWFTAWPGEVVEADEAGDEAWEEALTPAERLTFDEAAGFDERAVAEASDVEMYEEPRPDRVRVIVVPDAAGGDGGGGVEFDPMATDEEDLR